MAKEDKKILLIDLCARVFYNVKCKVYLDTKGYCLRDEDKYCDDTLESVNCRKQTCTFNKSIGYNFGNFAIEDVKPYLRPMSSMTEEENNERKQLGILCAINGNHERIFDGFGNESVDTQLKALDWLNAHQFDYRGLIPMGLALEAPKDMYKID